MPKLTEGRSVISTYPALVSTLTDFLTVSIHTILYHRDIYPRELYIKARKYNTLVYQCRHERVCKWIADALSAVAMEVLEGNVARVSLILISPNNTPLERYQFDLRSFPDGPPEEGHGGVRLLLQSGKAGGGPEDADEIKVAGLDAQFRACLMKLANVVPDMGRLPEDCTYTVALEMKDPGAPTNYAEIWVPAEGQGRDGTGLGPSGAKATPIRTVESGSLCLELIIEEAVAKSKMVMD